MSQACAYCLGPFEARMVPLALHSRRHGNSQMWLHVDCMRRAFAGAAEPLLDVEDMTVDLPSASA